MLWCLLQADEPNGVVNLRGAIVTASKRVKNGIEIETGSLITEKGVDRRVYVFTPVGAGVHLSRRDVLHELCLTPLVCVSGRGQREGSGSGHGKWDQRACVRLDVCGCMCVDACASPIMESLSNVEYDSLSVVRMFDACLCLTSTYTGREGD